jgi:hypothetical protein
MMVMVMGAERVAGGFSPWADCVTSRVAAQTSPVRERHGAGGILALEGAEVEPPRRCGTRTVSCEPSPPRQELLSRPTC